MTFTQKEKFTPTTYVILPNSLTDVLTFTLKQNGFSIFFQTQLVSKATASVPAVKSATLSMILPRSQISAFPVKNLAVQIQTIFTAPAPPSVRSLK